MIRIVAPEMNIDDLIGGSRRDSMDLIQLYDVLTSDEKEVYLGTCDMHAVHVARILQEES